MNTLYLVRHGENPANLTLEFASRHVDYALTEKGRLQAAQTAAFFRDQGIDEIYVSPLKRALETAAIIGAELGITPVMMENFREIEVGDLEGQPVSQALWDLHNQILLDWMGGHPERAFPNGDSYHSIWQRFSSGLVQITAGKADKKIMLVAHGGIFSATFSKLCPQDYPQIPFITFSGNCSVTQIALETENDILRGKLVEWGSVTHLSGEAANLVKGVPEGELYQH